MVPDPILAASSMAVALVPALVSSVFLVCVGYLTFRWNAEKARLELLRQKLEELFIAVQNFGESFTKMCMAYHKSWTDTQKREEPA